MSLGPGDVIGIAALCFQLYDTFHGIRKKAPEEFQALITEFDHFYAIFSEVHRLELRNLRDQHRLRPYVGWNSLAATLAKCSDLLEKCKPILQSGWSWEKIVRTVRWPLSTSLIDGLRKELGGHATRLTVHLQSVSTALHIEVLNHVQRIPTTPQLTAGSPYLLGRGTVRRSTSFLLPTTQSIPENEPLATATSPSSAGPQVPAVSPLLTTLTAIPASSTRSDTLDTNLSGVTYSSSYTGPGPLVYPDMMAPSYTKAGRAYSFASTGSRPGDLSSRASTMQTTPISAPESGMISSSSPQDIGENDSAVGSLGCPLLGEASIPYREQTVDAVSRSDLPSGQPGSSYLSAGDENLPEIVPARSCSKDWSTNNGRGLSSPESSPRTFSFPVRTNTMAPSVASGSLPQVWTTLGYKAKLGIRPDEHIICRLCSRNDKSACTSTITWRTKSCGGLAIRATCDRSRDMVMEADFPRTSPIPYIMSKRYYPSEERRVSFREEEIGPSVRLRVNGKSRQKIPFLKFLNEQNFKAFQELVYGSLCVCSCDVEVFTTSDGGTWKYELLRVWQHEQTSKCKILFWAKFDDKQPGCFWQISCEDMTLASRGKSKGTCLRLEPVRKRACDAGGHRSLSFSSQTSSSIAHSRPAHVHKTTNKHLHKHSTSTGSATGPLSFPWKYLEIKFATAEDHNRFITSWEVKE